MKKFGGFIFLLYICNVKLIKTKTMAELKDFTDGELMDEIVRRDIAWKVIDDVSTNILEKELTQFRKDATLVVPEDISSHKLMELLVEKEGRNALQIAICGALGLFNAFSYSKEELIKMIEDKL